MKKQGVLNHRISEVIASMGHGDMLVVADVGLPIPPGVERIDLAVKAGVPGLLEVVEVIASELQVEQLVIASELEQNNANFAGELQALFPQAKIQHLSHQDSLYGLGGVFVSVR